MRAAVKRLSVQDNLDWCKAQFVINLTGFQQEDLSSSSRAAAKSQILPIGRVLTTSDPLSVSCGLCNGPGRHILQSSALVHTAFANTDCC
jgi:hypothetical protein